MFTGESYYKGQQTTPKPTCTNTHSLLSGREPAGPLHATPYPHCGGLAQLGPPARLSCFHQPHLFTRLSVSVRKFIVERRIVACSRASLFCSLLSFRRAPCHFRLYVSVKFNS